MGNRLKNGAAVAFLSSLLTACASQYDINAPVGAISPMPLARTTDSGTAPSAAFMPGALQAAAAPAGFVSFCLRFPLQCQAKPGDVDTIHIDNDSWKKLLEINHAVNDSIWAEEDMQHYQRAEYWTIPADGYGDCEDIALLKRKQLIDSGFPEPALRMAVVITRRQERHAVLTVATSKGDFVLDNLVQAIRPWNATGYRWIERQHPQLGWVSVDPVRQMLASADTNAPTGEVAKP